MNTKLRPLTAQDLGQNLTVVDNCNAAITGKVKIVVAEGDGATPMGQAMIAFVQIEDEKDGPTAGLYTVHGPKVVIEEGDPPCPPSTK